MRSIHLCKYLYNDLQKLLLSNRLSDNKVIYLSLFGQADTFLDQSSKGLLRVVSKYEFPLEGSIKNGITFKVSAVYMEFDTYSDEAFFSISSIWVITAHVVDLCVCV